MEEKKIFLSPREKTIVECLKKGLIRSKEIARELNLSENYINAKFGDLYLKFALDNEQARARLVWEIMR